MQLTAIVKLRLAFVSLGVLLLVPFVWLVQSLDERVEAQRQLRHQVVAERIFDELERELTRVLAEQSARPSADFDGDRALRSTEPYVIGYFNVSRESARVLNDDSLSETERERIRRALSEASVLSQQQQAAPVSKLDALGAAEKVPSPKAPQQGIFPPSKSLSGSEVLRKLNRAGDERQQAPSRK